MHTILSEAGLQMGDPQKFPAGVARPKKSAGLHNRETHLDGATGLPFIEFGGHSCFGDLTKSAAELTHQDDVGPAVSGIQATNACAVAHQEDVGLEDPVALTSTDDLLSPHAEGVGQHMADIQRMPADTLGPTSGAAGHSIRDSICQIADRASLISAIRETYRQRQDLLNAETRLTLQIKALCRRAAEGDEKEADAIYDAVLHGKCDSAQAIFVEKVASPLLLARSFITKARKVPEKVLEKHAKRLHVGAFMDSICGFGWLGLGQIIGEAGDLSMYANPGKLWKRMGLAPFEGKSMRQWRIEGGLSASAWTALGYNPRRCSVMFVIGTMLIRKQNAYRDLYLLRKVKEAEKAPDLPKMAHHLRALRYVEKRLLRELWKSWRGEVSSGPAPVHLTPYLAVPDRSHD